MKFLIATAIFALAFAGWTAQAGDVTVSQWLQKDTKNLVNLSVSSAALNEAVNASINIYGHNSPVALQLPLTKSELKNLIYIELTTGSPKNNSIDPTFTAAVALGDFFFNEQSFFVVEIWNKPSAQVSQYIGGVEIQVAQLRLLPHKVRIPLTDETQSQIVGSIAVDWN